LVWLEGHFGDDLQPASVDMAELREFFVTCVECSRFLEEGIPDGLKFSDLPGKSLLFLRKWNEVMLVLLPQVIQALR
jgi:hypothetical protein